LNERDRNKQIDAVVSAAALVTDGDAAVALGVLIGAVVIMCSRSKDPVATMAIAMQSINTARDITIARQSGEGARDN
jgi:Co/Zn/Cd efflux system component